jgi:hypothetical protein
MIVFRKGVDSVPARLDPALREAWASCGLPAAPPRPYLETIVKPPPPPPPPPPDLPPAAPAGLRVLVLAGGAPVADAAVSVEPESGDGLEDTTDSAGSVHFEPEPGPVAVSVDPPAGYLPATRFLQIQPQRSHSLTVELLREADPPPAEDPPPQPTCDTDKWHEVFNACGKKVWFAGAKCTLGGNAGFIKCRGNPVCAAKAYAKFLACFAKSKHKEEALKCHDKANAESGCTYPRPK